MPRISLYPLLEYAYIRVAGERAQEFLQGQLTCDMREVTPTHSSLTAHCSPKGRALFAGRVLYVQPDFYIIIPMCMVPLVVDRLRKYALLSQVTVERTDALCCMGGTCETEGSAPCALPNCIDLPKEIDDVATYTISHTPSFALHIVQVHSAPRVSRFLMILPKEHSLSWLDKMKSDKTITIDDKKSVAWTLQDITAGISPLYPETSDLFTPHMLRYPELGAVSFKKGCYIGQEIIARTHFLGKNKRHLHHMRVTGISATLCPKPGDPIKECQTQKAVGVITEAAPCTDATWDMLAVLQDAHLSDALYWNTPTSQLEIIDTWD